MNSGSGHFAGIGMGVGMGGQEAMQLREELADAQA